MSNRYNHNTHHQKLHLPHHHPKTKTPFLPMLCSRPSIKDSTFPRCKEEDPSSSMSFSDDPLSPKIGCMGQVKRNNKIIGFPSSYRLTISSKTDTNHVVKYSKLKRFLSVRNITGSSPATGSAASKTASCREKEVIFHGGRRPKNGCGKDNSVSLNIEEMDPPLPVIKKVQKEGEMDSLWKRRSGGVALKTLQLQQPQICSHRFAPTTV